jgi:succinylglutamate desuccinylase
MSTHQEKIKQVLLNAQALLVTMNKVKPFYTHYNNEDHFNETIKIIQEIIESLSTGKLSHDDLSVYDAWINGVTRLSISMQAHVNVFLKNKKDGE